MKENQLENLYERHHPRNAQETIGDCFSDDPQRALIAFVRQTVENSILKQNPNLTAAELKVEVFKRYYGKEFSAEEQQRIIAHLLTH